MRLNHDCVRAVLLCVETHTDRQTVCIFVDPGNALSDDEIPAIPSYQRDLVKKYDMDTVLYSVDYCIEAELFHVDPYGDGCMKIITGLTPKGHEYTDNIRDGKIWECIKKTFSIVAPASFDIASKVASSTVFQNFMSSLAK